MPEIVRSLSKRRARRQHQHDIAEQTLIYVGLYTFGVVARYHPNVWMRALYGGSSIGAPTSDKTTALIREFVAQTANRLPDVVLSQLGMNTPQTAMLAE